jgi:hypothetical protein
MRAIVLVRWHSDDSFTEPYVVVEPIPEQPRPLQKLTEMEFGALPDQFRCYSCLQVYKKIDIGGIELGQRLCKHCYPWLDERVTGKIIRFDLRHGKPVEGYSVGDVKSKKPQFQQSPEIVQTLARSAEKLKEINLRKESNELPERPGKSQEGASIPKHPLRFRPKNS